MPTRDTAEKPDESPEGDDAPTPASSEAGEKDDDEAPPKDPSLGPVVSQGKRSRPPYKYDPNKITLRFLFANRDGLNVTVECNPSDTVGEVKGALLSVWPEGMCQFIGRRKWLQEHSLRLLLLSADQ